jgi:colanic acid/amylovoran biosynthesis glycosyltransferase
MSAGLAHPLPSMTAGSTTARTRAARHRIAYVMSRFPKLTETFVLDEILEHERKGITVEVFPLWRERARVIHPEARPIVARAVFTPTLDLEILRDNFRCFARAPRRYLETLGILIRGNARSPRFLVGALAIFPKACSLGERMRALGIEHVHAHFASHPAAAAFVIGRLAGIPWSFTAHGSDLHREQAMLVEKVREARFVVAISEFNRRFILDRVGEVHADKIELIHCGIDPEQYPARTENAGSKPDTDLLEIVCVGTLHAVKGQKVLLEACAELSTCGIRWRCHLIGDGPDRGSLEALASTLGIAAHVVFHGSCERERVRELFATMQVAVAPSVPTRDGRREGIPVVLMEAAATGLPLVASRLSGIPELVRDDDTGLLVEPGDVAGLAAALTRIAREPATARRLGAAARARLEQDFDLERNVTTLRERIIEGLPR